MGQVFGALVFLSAFVSGCFLNRNRPDQYPEQREPAYDSDQDQGAGPDGKDTASLKFDLEALKNYNINLSGVKYRLTYHGVHEGTKDIIDGRAELNIQKLPANKPADLRLEFIEQSTTVLRGDIKNVTLKPGLNELEIELEDLRTADLKIRLKIGGDQAADPNRDNSGRPPLAAPPPGGNQPQNPTPPPANNSPPALPAVWDGRSFLTLDDWLIRETP